ncbi:Predicted arabinose efflux permease, MFS family [Paenibacillus algorifonticola]|uniref:Predicted arabinose efflux permease, MFS family n=1 Tax=Paenibacillus algorifonticola TaxID=684063 RepID=A0A1I2IS99_9BACL|nr:MFS transporter [Paenibacillus algorifonticola]SFF45159.1 Predicted arabinose efflux permease, MFS family [Paenibacillus algorifonticola]
MNQLNPKLWTKEFIFLSAVNFFITLIFFLLNATITLYAINEFNATSSQAGIIAGVFIIGSLIGRLLTGRLVKSKKILITGLLFFILTTLLYFIHYNISFLILSRFVNGITVGMAQTVVGTVVILTLPASRKGEGISYFAISTALATGIGPFIGMYMSQNANFNMIFYFCLLLGIINFIIAIFMNIPVAKNTETKKGKGLKLSDFIELKVLPIAIIAFLMSFCFSGIISYLNVYALELKLVKAASFFFMVYTVFVLISRPFTGRIVDKKGANIIMYPAFVIFGAGLLLLSSVTSGVTLLLAAALVALGFGNISSISQAVSISLAEPHRIGLATATFFIFIDLGNGFGPSVIGAIIPYTGYNGLYAVLGLIVLSTFVFYYYLYGRKEGAIRKQMSTTE